VGVVAVVLVIIVAIVASLQNSPHQVSSNSYPTNEPAQPSPVYTKTPLPKPTNTSTPEKFFAFNFTAEPTSVLSLSNYEKWEVIGTSSEKADEIKCSPSGNLIAVRLNQLIYILTKDFTEISSLPVNAYEEILGFSDDETGLYTRYTNTVNLRNIENGVVMDSFSVDTMSTGGAAMGLSPDGKFVASVGTSYVNANMSYYDNLEIINTSDHVLQWSRQADSSPNMGGINIIEFSPDGTVVASGGYDSRVRLWRVSDGELLVALPLQYNINAMAFSYDGKYLAVNQHQYGNNYNDGADIGNIVIWNIGEGTTRTLSTDTGDMAFSLDGKILVTGPQIWRVSDGTLLRTIEGSGFQFSPDGIMLIAWYRNGIVFWGIKP
jgi:WD40 repeat protein